MLGDATATVGEADGRAARTRNMKGASCNKAACQPACCCSVTPLCRREFHREFGLNRRQPPSGAPLPDKDATARNKAGAGGAGRGAYDGFNVKDA